MDRSAAPGEGGGARFARNDGNGATILLRSIEFPGSHGLLKGCSEEVGWRDTGSLCPEPAWTPERGLPISCTMGESLSLELDLALQNGAAGPEEVQIVGRGPGVIQWSGAAPITASPGTKLTLTSTRPVPKRIDKLDLTVRWSAGSGDSVSPATSQNIVYVTMGRPEVGGSGSNQEEGITVKRMDLAVSWVAPLATLRPHAIVHALMRKFPYYALRPSPKVPRRFHHPTYFNEEGGAWPMSDYVAESGECQAIVRLVRGVLRQLGVPGTARAVLVWADPEVNEGRTALSSYWDEDPSAGLDRTKMVRGRRWLATLVDQRVEEGKEYPPSHTIGADGAPSPGFNRYEACLEFTHDGVTLEYGGGAGVFHDKDSVLRAFWGLVWVSGTKNDGFRVEKIVRQY